MTDLVKIETRSPEMWFAITAITLSKHDVPPRDDGHLEVCMTINGVEVSFIDTAKDWSDRMQKQIEEIAAQKAIDRFESEISAMTDVLRESGNAIRNAVERSFNVRLGDDE